MEKEYFIESPHTKEECIHVLKDMAEADKKNLSRFRWGCMSGDHTGWAIVEARDLMEAKNMVPSRVQHKAKVVEVEEITPKQLEEMH